MEFIRRLLGRKTFAIQPDDLQMWQNTRRNGIENVCGCFHGIEDGAPFREVVFHEEKNLEGSEAWRCLEELIEAALAKGSRESAPGLEMPGELWEQVATLPPSISKLTRVKKLYLYGSYLERIPPQIGDMLNLRELDMYSSYRLHWLPFEVTRCEKLERSRFSTRALYGNHKYRSPFPRLPSGQSAHIPGKCSICERPMHPSSVRQVWISLMVGRDVLPLLVNACSQSCIDRLPHPAEGFVDRPHVGGPELVQPERS